MNKFNIGIDFGGVLSVHDRGESEHINTSINMPNAQKALETLQNHNLYLVSFCGKNRAVETHESLVDTGLSKLFQKEYYVKDKKFKSDVCKYLGCHFMIDDRIGILDNVKAVNPNIITILFGGEGNSHKTAKDWNDVLEIINNTPYFQTKTAHDVNLTYLIHAV